MKELFIVPTAAILMLFVTGQRATASETTIRMEEHGIVLTLPERWELTDLTDKYTPTPQEKKVPIAWAKDEKGRADIELYAMEAEEGLAIDEWVGGLIPRHLARRSSPYGYESARAEHKEATVEPGTTVNIIYYRLHYILPFNRERSLAFVYFEHAGYYFYMFVYNRRFYPLEWELEKTILPGLSLLD